MFRFLATLFASFTCVRLCGRKLSFAVIEELLKLKISTSPNLLAHLLLV